MAPLRFSELLIDEGLTGLDTVWGAASQPSLSLGTLDHIRALERSVDCVESYFTYFFALPVSEYASMPMAHLAYFSRNLTTLYWLSVLDDPAWDRAAVRRRVDVLATTDAFLRNIMEIPRVCNFVMDGQTTDVFTRFAKIVKCIRDGWATDLENTGENPRATRQDAGQEETAAAEFTQADLLSEIEGDEWVREVFMNWDDMVYR